MRFVQHKKEAYWFYRFLSIFYDKLVNPLFWTERMRDASLELAELNDPGLSLIDVGSGTGFTTQGIVKNLPAGQVTCVDQSPHQMAKARKKEELQGCTFQLGDAEDIPFPTDHFDRYVSAGSIEYWPDPLKGIQEAYRVIKPGGIALMIGPLEPGNRIGRFIAKTWMLFPKEIEYLEWYRQAGFVDIKVKYIRPHWFKGDAEYGIALAGKKPKSGISPTAAPKQTKQEEGFSIGRLLLGSLAGFLFIPAALFGYLRQAFVGQKDVPPAYREKLNPYQISAILLILAILASVVWLLI